MRLPAPAILSIALCIPCAAQTILCADFDGFSLHAGERVAAGDRKRLEHLLR